MMICPDSIVMRTFAGKQQQSLKAMGPTQCRLMDGTSHRGDSYKRSSGTKTGGHYPKPAQQHAAPILAKAQIVLEQPHILHPYVISGIHYMGATSSPAVIFSAAPNVTQSHCAINCFPCSKRPASL